MEIVFLRIGQVLCAVGGIALAVFLLFLLLELALEGWRMFSDRFRAVCQAESLIFEYKEYRQEFRAWLNSSASREVHKPAWYIDADAFQCELLDLAYPIWDQDPILDAMDRCTVVNGKEEADDA